MWLWRPYPHVFEALARKLPAALLCLPGRVGGVVQPHFRSPSRVLTSCGSQIKTPSRTSSWTHLLPAPGPVLQTLWPRDRQPGHGVFARGPLFCFSLLVTGVFSFFWAQVCMWNWGGILFYSVATISIFLWWEVRGPHYIAGFRKLTFWLTLHIVQLYFGP